MKDKPNISIFTIDYGAGGTERVISLLLPELCKDFNVTLVLFYNYIDYEIPEGVNLIILKPDTKKSKTYLFKIKNFFTLYFRYNKFIKRESIDVSISLLPIPNIINSFVAMYNTKVKTIISERCYPSIMYNQNKFTMVLAKTFFPLLYNRNKILFSNSVYINQDLKNSFGVKIPMEVIYNPIETNENQKINWSLIKTTKKFKLINVGQLYSAKNQKLILEALNHSKDNNLHLTFVGSGELMDDLKSLAATYQLSEQVHFTGKVGNVKAHMLESDCFVLSSDTEGFPNVLLEALSVGLPSISTNCLSGPLELLNDNEDIVIEKGAFFKAKYGLLVNTNDIIGLSNAIKYFYNNPKERQYYSELAFERSKEYNLPKIYQQVKSLIDN